MVIEKDEHGYYAYSPELPGCQTQGNSLDEVMVNIKEAIELYLETLSEDEKKALLSEEILTTTLEVMVDWATKIDRTGGSAVGTLRPGPLPIVD